MADTTALVVFSHLRWNFVYQRPQHVLSRLADLWPVLYVEEPVVDLNNPPHWVFSEPAPDVLICQPHTPVTEPGFCAAQMPVLRALMDELVTEKQIRHAIAWMYTPLALPLAQALPVEALVYDCMDELSMFLHAPPELLINEAELLATADVVFTGGQSLFQAKQGRNPYVFCFPSSVDGPHFQAAQPTAVPPLAEPEDQRDLPHPRLGYYGVIDERMDLELLDALASQHPEWQIVMVGPVVKIDPANLPRHPNLHYLGQRSYEALPAYLSGWDVCLLPFARNDATRFISPTKTVEYMAAERMIVSTPLTDVARPYGEIVFLGDSVAGFVSACERALQVSPAEREGRLRKMREVIQRTSWNTTAAGMAYQVEQALERRQSELPELAGQANAPGSAQPTGALLEAFAAAPAQSSRA
ncbi:MAG TPA: glycosyltransferase [Chloroflexia bacterium]|nr:glycosyltransferase [Chloroflexia bacterium]